MTPPAPTRSTARTRVRRWFSALDDTLVFGQLIVGLVRGVGWVVVQLVRGIGRLLDVAWWT